MEKIYIASVKELKPFENGAQHETFLCGLCNFRSHKSRSRKFGCCCYTLFSAQENKAQKKKCSGHFEDDVTLGMILKLLWADTSRAIEFFFLL